MNLKMRMLAFQIEQKWKKIEQNRQKMNMLIEMKVPYTSDQLIRLNDETVELGEAARKLELEYRQLHSAMLNN